MVGPRFEFLVRAYGSVSSQLRRLSMESQDSGPTFPAVEPMRQATLARFRLAWPTKNQTRSCTQPPSVCSKYNLRGIVRQENTLGCRDGEFARPVSSVTAHQCDENQPEEG